MADIPIGKRMSGIAVPVMSADQVIREETAQQDEVDLRSLEELAAKESAFRNSLAGHIISEFNINKSAKETSGIREEIIESLRAFNGEYSPQDKARIIEEGGSQIFMNITATKARAARSWIADILKPARGKAWTMMPTPNPDLPMEMHEAIEAAIEKEFTVAAKPPEQPQQPQQPGQKSSPAAEAQETIREINQTKRDIKTAFHEEIQKEASFQMSIMERQTHDQLTEGKWDASLSTFINDFVVYPTAFLKGPIVTKGVKLTWEQGQAVKEQTILFKNGRVDPLDMYPSPSATCTNDGNSIEHMRLSFKDISDLRGLPSYHEEVINKVLDGSSESEIGDYWYTDGTVETEKASQERRGNESDANRGVLHALHFFGPISAKVLRQWEFECEGFDESLDDNSMVEVEAILVKNEVIKCVANSDPLLRRPYYKASYVERPGSYWGRSLPNLMRDIQRLCNATARALANNLGIASGPQVEVYIDRLAQQDTEELEEMRPRQIWQLKSDPAGSGGRAMNWFQPTSNAGELLKVYAEFEQRADDVTGIPRYAYGNEKLAGAAATLGGLSMLLESSSKIIKDAIRNIDEGVIKPRVEYQFYMNMLRNPNKFTGDVTVVPIGSSVLSIKAFETMRRNEFLTATANQFDQETMGKAGRANILRKMGEDLGFDSNPIPTEFELKRKEEKAAQAAAAQAQKEQQEKDKELQVDMQKATYQSDGQERMAAGAQMIKQGELQNKQMTDQANLQLRAAEIDQRDRAIDKELAVKAVTGTGI